MTKSLLSKPTYKKLAGGAEGVYTLLDKAAGEIGYTADQLVKEVLAAATQVVTEKLPVAALAFVAKKLSLVPGVGAVLSLYDGLMWLLDPQTVEQIEKVVNPAIEGIKAVAQGNAQGQQLLANNVKEALLAGVPVALSFAVKQVPTLDKLPAAVRDALQSVSKTVEDKLTAWLKTVKDKLAAPFKSRPGLIGEVQKFKVPGSTETYELWLTRGADGKLTIMLDGIGDAAKLDLQKDLPDLSAAMEQRIAAAMTKVLVQGEKLVEHLSSKPPKLKDASALQSPTGAFGAALKELADALIGAPCNRLLAACFARGTLQRTPGGLQAIETLRPGDRVLSRDEYDPRGWADYKVVEEVFERLGWVWHLTAAGRLIRTTGEHPFFEQSKGWLPCRELNVGDRLVCEDGTMVLVEEVVDTGVVEVVYNLRVADWHTYFVGGEDWGFSVWVHNTSDPAICVFRAEHNLNALQPNSTDPIDNRYCSTVAKVVIDGKPVFGVNKDVPNGVAMRPWRLYEGAIRRQLYERLQQEHPGTFDRMPQFLAHAEFTCLYLASAGLTKMLPQHLKMDSDRALCPFSDGCIKNLAKVLPWFGITELYIRDAHDDVTKFTASGPVALQKMTLEQWKAFNP